LLVVIHLLGNMQSTKQKEALPFVAERPVFTKYHFKKQGNSKGQK
jgi:flagellar basal body rod protein FlgC